MGNHQFTSPALDGPEGSGRLLLSKTHPCSSKCPCVPGPRLLFRTNSALWEAQALAGPVYYADISFKHAWNTTRRQPRPGSDRTASHPTFAVRRPAPHRKSFCDSRRPGRLFLLQRLGREVSLSLTRTASSFASITASQKEVTASHSPSLPTMD